MPPINKLSAEKYDYENIHLLNFALGPLFQNVGCSRQKYIRFFCTSLLRIQDTLPNEEEKKSR